MTVILNIAMCVILANLFFLDYEWEGLMHGQDLQSLEQDSYRKILLISDQLC